MEDPSQITASSREGSIRVSLGGLLILPGECYCLSHTSVIHLFFTELDVFSRGDYGLACLLRMPNTVAFVTKIDIQILHLLSRSFSACVSHSCCAAGKEDEMMAGGEGWRHFICCVI